MHGSLNESQAKQLFAAFGIPGVREVMVDAVKPKLDGISDFGEKCVVKILSNEIVHKTEVGGVALNVPLSDIPEKLSAMVAKVHLKSGISITQFLVQEMVSGGLELMIGMHRDPLGTAILVGMGGVTAELFKDTHIWIPV